MAGISAVGGMSAQQIQQQYAVRTASMVKDALEQEGEMAQKPIASAAAAGDTGNKLNVLV